jgi:hypothetical protein
MLPAIWTERIKCYFELFPYVFINEDVMGFPTFQADDATKVQPTKIHHNEKKTEKKYGWVSSRQINCVR